ncbi:TPA: hypothetical protein J1460_001640 [Escherichia coli]|nr:hypothetical protein [Escherichia coli]EJE7592218.1 hypothetical protein [Escherichia coli]HBA9707713.1 hypothetical protein [Escherichia coli]
MKKIINYLMSIFISETESEDVKMKWKATIIGSIFFAVLTYNYVVVPVLASQGLILSPIPIEQIGDILTSII